MPVSLTLFLAAMAASLMVSGSAAIAALREPALGLKPLWALLALTGLGGAALVPAVPGAFYWFLGMALPTASFSAAAGSWQPEVLRVLFPFGALAVLVRIAVHRRRQRVSRGRDGALAGRR